MGLAVALEYCELARARPPRCARLLDPVAAGDAEVEQPVGDVAAGSPGAAGSGPRRRGGRRWWPGSRRPSPRTTARSAAANSSRVAFSSEPLGRTSLQHRRLPTRSASPRRASPTPAAGAAGRPSRGRSRPPRSPCCRRRRARAVEGLVDGVGGEHAEDHRACRCRAATRCRPDAHSPATKSKWRGVAPDDRAQADHGVDRRRLRPGAGHQRQLEGAGHPGHGHRVGLDAARRRARRGRRRAGAR